MRSQHMGHYARGSAVPCGLRRRAHAARRSTSHQHLATRARSSASSQKGSYQITLHLDLYETAKCLPVNVPFIDCSHLTTLTQGCSLAVPFKSCVVNVTFHVDSRLDCCLEDLEQVNHKPPEGHTDRQNACARPPKRFRKTSMSRNEQNRPPGRGVRS